MQVNRRIKLDEGTTGGQRFHLLGETKGPDQARRSIEQVARTISAEHRLFGRVELTEATFAAFIKNFTAGTYGQDIYLDRNHDIGQGVAGKFTRLFSRGPVLLAELEWTDFGVKVFRDDGFKYFSVEFTDDFEHPETKQKHGPLMIGAALTPRPFIKNMKPTDGPGRLTLSEGRSVFVPDYLNLQEATDMDFLKRLRAALEAKKLSEALILILLADAEAKAKKLSNDEPKLKALMDDILAAVPDAPSPAAAPAQTPAPSPVQLSEQQLTDAVNRAIEARETAAAAQRSTTDQNRKQFRDAINGAQGLSDDTRQLLLEQEPLITAGMSADQVKGLADNAIKMGNTLEVQRQRAAIGLPGGAGHVLSVHASGDVGDQVHGIMRERLMLTDAFGAGQLRAPEAKDLSPFARKILKLFDAIHGRALDQEYKRLAGDGSTNIADGAFPVVAQRQVIVELLADLKFLSLVQTIVDPQAQSVIQIPYEERNTTGITNGAVVYEGQPINYAGVRQRMDISYVLPRKIALLMSNEMIHFARVAQINWDAWGRNIGSNSRLMRDIICAAIANEMQRAADLFGHADIVTEDMEPQFNGTRTTFKTLQWPVVRPYQPKDLQGNNVGTADAVITVVYDGDPITEYPGGSPAAGFYWRFTSFNLGYFQIVTEAGTPVAVADTTTCTMSYSYATNVAKFDIDPASLEYDVHLNGLLRAIGRRKALLQQERFVPVQFAICSNALHNTITEAEQFEANSEKPGNGLDGSGDLQMVKGIPFWGTNQPGVDLEDSRILMGERGTSSYGIAKPFATGMPFEVIDPSTSKPTGEKQAYGEEYSSIHTPLPLRGRLSSVIVYSATARTAV